MPLLILYHSHSINFLFLARKTCNLQLKVKGILKIGNAVAITDSRALTALHGCANAKTEITLITRSGRVLTGKVEFRMFTETLVDIAVIVLQDRFIFMNFLP